MIFGDVGVEAVPRGAGLPAVLARVRVRAGEVEVLHVLPHVPPPVLCHAAEEAAMARSVRHLLYVGIERLLAG